MKASSSRSSTDPKKLVGRATAVTADDYPDEASTVVPADTLHDDSSESTDWVGLEQDLGDSSEASTGEQQHQQALGRLVEGPGGKPVRVFATSSELRRARLQQLQEPVAKSGVRKPAAKAGAAPATPGAASRAIRSEEARRQAKKALEEKLKAQAQSGVALPSPAPARDDAATDAQKHASVARPRSCSRQRPSQETRQEAGRALQEKLTSRARSAAVRPPVSPAQYGSHRTLGRPGATHSLPCGHIPFRDTASGYPERPSRAEQARHIKASDAKAALDKRSEEEIREMGLWRYTPVKNPVVKESDSKRGGFNWNIPFQEFEHTLGGVPDSKPLERPHKAETIRLQLEKHSKEELREMGLWEHMPARNPIVKESDSARGGYNWHVGFQDFQHTLGGVPDPKPVERPHRADEIHRQLDVMSRQQLRDAGLFEHAPARNPVVTESCSRRGGMNWNVAF